MGAKFFKFQFFLFGDYDEVVASSENINFFVNKFLPLNFIPKQVQEISLNLKGKNPKDFEQEFINRISLNSLDKKREIIFNRDRITFNYSFDVVKEDDFNLDLFKKSILEYLILIEEKFNKKFYRLGIVIDKLIDVEDTERDKVFLKFNTASNFLGEELSPVEWTNKIVVRKKIEELNNEIVNISNMNSFIEARLNSNTNSNKDIDFKGIHNVIDINTLSALVDKRFNRDDVEVFLSNVNVFTEEILEYNQIN